jgi:uncharacterized membrane protein
MISAYGARLRRAQRGMRAGVPGLVYLATMLYIVFYAWLAVMRHEMFQSSALDLGYTDQVVWNTLHGRFLRFSTFQNAPLDLPLAEFAHTDILLAYHVELLLVPIALLYLVWASPLCLLVLQAAVIGLGALPAYWLARDHLQSVWAGLVFALAYLLAPAVEGASLADFHAVSLTASLLLFAFYLVHRQRWGPYLATILLALSAREDVALLVLMLGLYLLLHRRRWQGALTFCLGAGWFLICTQVILPHYSGFSISPFLHRVLVFGPTPLASLHNLLADPGLLLRWVRQPAIITYLQGLLASAGFMSLLSPATLAIATPVLAMNIFSSWSWTYAEGDHYSASLIPIIIVSGIYGLGFLSARLAKWTRLPVGHMVSGLAALVLCLSVYHHVQIGVSPMARTFTFPHLTAHDRLGRELAALIPRQAAVSAQSNLYPHVAQRTKAYLFPAINDAEYIFLDVTSTPFPVSLDDLFRQAQQLVRSGEYSVLAARDGYLLLRRGAAEVSPLPPEFYAFARASERDPGHALQVTFGDVLELVGYDYSPLNVVHATDLPATITTYWKLLRPAGLDYRFVFFFSRGDGAIVWQYDGETPATLWYPPADWHVGETVRVQTPILSVGRLRDVILAVLPPGKQPASIQDRLKPITAGDGHPLDLYEEGSMLRLFSLQGRWR